MRYDKLVKFQMVGSVYTNKGDYEEQVLNEYTEYASIVDTDFQTMAIVYGGIKQGSITLHLLNKVKYDFNRIVYEGKAYTVDQVINQRTKQAYILSQWQT